MFRYAVFLRIPQAELDVLYNYQSNGAYHLAYRGHDDENNAALILEYDAPDGTRTNLLYNKFIGSWADYPANPWIEVSFEGDQHTMTLYEDDGTTVYYTDTTTHTGGPTDGYIGLTSEAWDTSNDGVTAQPHLDNFELEIIPEPATMSIFAGAGQQSSTPARKVTVQV